MLHLDVTGNKKRKRCGRVFRFKNFGEPGYPIKFTGGFRENVKALLEFAYLEGALCKGMPLWSFQLEVHRHPLFHILLFVVEESTEASLNLHCKHCEYVGWGHHLICNRRYHFLLPSKDTLAACLSCESRYDDDTACNSIDKNKSNIMELKGHIMHGVFHSNGFGHLLCVNGLEMGSDLAGHQIMQFWDRLCTSLRARNVSLSDFSMKKGMELRLLHGIAYGQPWFGRWGYKFKRGSYGVTYSMYQKAIEAMKGMPLSLFIHHTATISNHDIPLIISRYQSLSDKTLATLGDLFLLMFELKSQLPHGNNTDSYSLGELLENNCRWSPKRVEMASRVIVEALKRAEFRWVSRQEVRDTARTYIGDTGLLDFVLKSLSNHIVGNYLVRRSLNPVTKVLEYCLEDVSNVFPSHDMNKNQTSHVHYKLTRVQLMKDLFCLYRYILKDRKQQEGIISAIQVAARIVLDTKLLAKDYNGELPFQVELSLEGRLSLYCTVKLRGDGDSNKALVQPYECIPLKTNATIDDLKLEIERNFSEIYWGLRGFVVESIVNLNGKGSDLVFGLMEVGRKLVVEGTISHSHDREACMIGDIYEANPKNKIVDCTCGTKDDDGERMVSCDICEVLQHTRCVRIPNDEEAPFIFICRRCEQEIIFLPSL